MPSVGNSQTLSRPCSSITCEARVAVAVLGADRLALAQELERAAARRGCRGSSRDIAPALAIGSNVGLHDRVADLAADHVVLAPVDLAPLHAAAARARVEVAGEGVERLVVVVVGVEDRVSGRSSGAPPEMHRGSLGMLAWVKSVGSDRSSGPGPGPERTDDPPGRAGRSAPGPPRDPLPGRGPGGSVRRSPSVRGNRRARPPRRRRRWRRPSPAGPRWPAPQRTSSPRITSGWVVEVARALADPCPAHEHAGLGAQAGFVDLVAPHGTARAWTSVEQEPGAEAGRTSDGGEPHRRAGHGMGLHAPAAGDPRGRRQRTGCAAVEDGCELLEHGGETHHEAVHGYVHDLEVGGPRTRRDARRPTRPGNPPRAGDLLGHQGGARNGNSSGHGPPTPVAISSRHHPRPGAGSAGSRGTRRGARSS